MSEEKPEEKSGFLSRWSRRKSTASAPQPEGPIAQTSLGNTTAEEQRQQEQELVLDSVGESPLVGELAVVESLGESAGEPRSDHGSAEPPVLTDADMPDVSTLDENSDYAGFMSPGVSEELRKLALRKLFAGVGFNIRDGLDDYDDDFRNFAALGDIITSDMRHQMEVEEEKKKEEERLAELEKTADDAADKNADSENPDDAQAADDKALESSQTSGDDDGEAVAESNESRRVSHEKSEYDVGSSAAKFQHGHDDVPEKEPQH